MVSFGIGIYIATQFVQSTYDKINVAAPNILGDQVFLSWLNLRIIVIQAFYVLLSFVIFLSLCSSFIDTMTWQRYLINAFAGLIITPIAIWIVASWWNEFAGVAATSIFTEISTTFVSSWTLILTLNLFFGLASFVFMRRTQ